MNEPVTANARRFETYIRWSAYSFVLTVPLIFLLSWALIDTYRPGWPIAAMGALVLAYTVLALRWVSRGISSWRGVRPKVLPGMIPLLLATVALAGTLQPFMGLRSSWPQATMLVIAVTAMSHSVWLKWPQALLLIAALGVPAIITAWATPVPWGSRIAFAVFSWLYCFFIVLSGWSMVWLLRVLYQLQDAQADQARLAVAEERVRISRDLHDVFGRTLAAISVKSQLAEQLARRGRNEEAAEEMAAIRRVSEQAGTEVRRVVRGEVETALAQELEGARALLSSAGIATAIIGDEAPLTRGQSTALGWVVREGVTNMLRHSRATQASIALDATDGNATLIISNDGAPGRTGDPKGSGLRSMGERLAALGGNVTVESVGGWFTVTAVVPAVAPSEGKPS